MKPCNVFNFANIFRSEPSADEMKPCFGERQISSSCCAVTKGTLNPIQLVVNNEISIYYTLMPFKKSCTNDKTKNAVEISGLHCNARLCYLIQSTQYEQSISINLSVTQAKVLSVDVGQLIANMHKQTTRNFGK